ncbi:MAG: DUF4339 domain-containing protein [Planctomycetaceae bacterium]|nr:DUF4339 domain-containing protein [Planctomycetaceae bacterium]
MKEWYYAKGQQQFGPIPEDRFRAMLGEGVILPSDLIWSADLPDWQPARHFPELFPRDSTRNPPAIPFRDQNVANTRLAAGICAIVAGSFGVHKFVLGMTTPGVIMLVVSIATCFVGGIVMHVIAIVEGIKYLLMSDEEFHQTYMVEKKEWF